MLGKETKIIKMIFSKLQIVKLFAIFKLPKKGNNNPDTIWGTSEFQNENKLLLHLPCGKKRHV